MNTVTFDLETKYLSSDLPLGWDSPPAEFGITCLVQWASATGRPHVFDENTLENAVQMLQSADCILSFNGVKFDLPIIEGIYGEKVGVKHHLDMLQLIWDATTTHGSHKAGYKLTECCQRSLGTSKNGDGLLAPALAEQGRWCELIDYCVHDVLLTKNLFKFAQEHGGVVSPEGEILILDFPEWFKDLEI
jgi:DEAD/DEAH box helicase domain-containing protein